METTPAPQGGHPGGGTPPLPQGTAPTPGDPAPASGSKPGPGGPPPDVEGGGGGPISSLLGARATLAFLAASGVVLWLSWKQTGQFGDFGGSAVYQRWVYHWPAVRDQGEWWRYFTTLYVSRHAIDALIYGYLFLQLAPPAEKALGTVRFALLYLLAGAGAVGLAEVLNPGFRAVGTITAAYALLGSLPGLVLGATGSLKRMLAHPSTTSAGFWLLLAVVVDQMVPGAADAFSRVAAVFLGMLLGAGFMFTRTGRPIGWAIAALGALIALGAVFMSMKEVAWRDGKLGARGRPLGMEQPELPTAPPDPDPLGTPEQADSEVEQARAQVAPFLHKFGPLPTGTVPPDDPLELSPAEIEQATSHLMALDKLAKGKNLVGLELDPERVKLMILLGQRQMAARVAEDYLVALPRDTRPLEAAQARALAGAALMSLGGAHNLEKARDLLEGALLNNEGFGQQVPEAVYHVGWIYLAQGDRVAALPWLEKFLTLVDRNPEAQPPWRRPMVQHALVELE